MGKADRIKGLRADSDIRPNLAEFRIIVAADGNVSVSGPINENPQAIMDTFGRALASIANHQAKLAAHAIVVPKPNIILPGGN